MVASIMDSVERLSSCLALLPLPFNFCYSVGSNQICESLVSLLLGVLVNRGSLWRVACLSRNRSSDTPINIFSRVRECACSEGLQLLV